MINISFLNLIFIIVDNVSSFGKPSNLHPFTSVIPSNSHFSALVIYGSLCFFISIEFSNLNNFIAHFLINVFTISFDNFSIDAFSNLAVDSASLFAILFFLNFPLLVSFCKMIFLHQLRRLFLLLVEIFLLIIFLALVIYFFLFSHPLIILLLFLFLSRIFFLIIFLALIVYCLLFSCSLAILLLILFLVRIFFSTISLALVVHFFFSLTFQ